jgi:hypothetical protein
MAAQTILSEAWIEHRNLRRVFYAASKDSALVSLASATQD